MQFLSSSTEFVSTEETSSCTPINETLVWNSEDTIIDAYFGTSGISYDANIPKSLTSGFKGDLRELSI
jgi:hypothetical protein